VAPPAAATVKAKPTYSFELEPDLSIGASVDEEEFEVFRLLRWGHIKGKPVTPEASAAVNLLVVDKQKNTSAWLFPGFDRVLIGEEALLTGRWYYREPDIDDDVPVHLMVLRTIEADTDHDGILTQDDRQTLYAVSFEGQKPKKILEADHIWFDHQKNKSFVAGYREKGIGHLVTYALPDFSVTSDTVLAGLPK